MWKKVGYIILGNLTYAFGVGFFVEPSNLLTGGTTGIALFIRSFADIPVSYLVLALNVLFFLLGLFVLGKKFALTTLLSTFCFPIFLNLSEQIYTWCGPVSDSRLLSLIFAGILIGVGLGIVIQSGASTGGMDIPPIILNRKFGLPISSMLFVFDFIILLGQIVVADRQSILYGILLVILYTWVLNTVSINSRRMTQLLIISECYEEVSMMINERFDRGTTLLHGQGGYKRTEKDVLLCIVDQREVYHIKQAVLEMDESAFIVTHDVNEVNGRGFSMDKIYLSNQ